MARAMLRNDPTQPPRAARESGFVALSKSGTLYAGIPRGGGCYRVTRCRVHDRDGAPPLVATWEGRVVPVRAAESTPGAEIRCDRRAFTPVVSGGAAPILGERLAVGVSAKVAAEVSSPITWIAHIAPDRTWAVEPIVRAFRNGDASWRRLVGEVPYESGDEGFEDEELAEPALDSFYRRHLARRAELRERHRLTLGHDVAPRIVVVSNESLADALAAAGLRPFPRATLAL